MRRSWYLVLNALFILALAGSVIGLFYNGGRESWFLIHAAHAQGKVTAVETSIQRSKRAADERTVYRPTVSFQDAGGKAWNFTPDRAGSDGRRVGAVLPVVYDPTDPADAQIASFFREWDATLDFVYIGAFAFVAIVGLRQLAMPPKPISPRDPAILAGP